jgi:DNA-binding beta-propeller fold protein YncE
VLKFTRTGRFLTQIGKAGEIGTTDSQTRLNRPAAVALDFALRELVVADGGSSQRVVVFDAATASYKRHWVVDEKTIARTRVLAEQGLTGGAVRPFTRLSSIVVTPDSRVYAGDRAYNGIVVRWANGGSFGFVAPDAGGARSVWAMALSDPVASTLFVADGQRGQVLLLDSRTFAVTLTVGRPGLEPGSFQRLGSVAVDSQGNLYTGETHEGARLQRFTRKKMKK